MCLTAYLVRSVLGAREKKCEDQIFVIGINLQFFYSSFSLHVLETGKTGQEHQEMFSAKSDIKYRVKVKHTAGTFTGAGWQMVC